MDQNLTIQNELDQLKVSLIAGLTANLEVPSGYFDQFSETMLDLIYDEKSLIKVGNSNPLQVSSSYFNEFEADLMAKIKNDSIETFSKEMPFNLPIEYFKQNELKIQHIIRDLPTQSVGDFSDEPNLTKFLESSNEIRIKPQEVQLKITKRKLSYSLAIAASILIILTFSFYIFNTSSAESKQALVNHTIESQLDKLPVTEVDDYIQQNQSEFISDINTELLEDSDIDLNKLENEILDGQLKNFTTEELSNYL